MKKKLVLLALGLVVLAGLFALSSVSSVAASTPTPFPTYTPTRTPYPTSSVNPDCPDQDYLGHPSLYDIEYQADCGGCFPTSTPDPNNPYIFTPIALPTLPCTCATQTAVALTPSGLLQEFTQIDDGEGGGCYCFPTPVSVTSTVTPTSASTQVVGDTEFTIKFDGNDVLPDGVSVSYTQFSPGSAYYYSAPSSSYKQVSVYGDVIEADFVVHFEQPVTIKSITYRLLRDACSLRWWQIINGVAGSAIWDTSGCFNNWRLSGYSSTNLVDVTSVGFGFLTNQAVKIGVDDIYIKYSGDAGHFPTSTPTPVTCQETTYPKSYSQTGFTTAGKALKRDNQLWYDEWMSNWTMKASFEVGLEQVRFIDFIPVPGSWPWNGNVIVSVVGCDGNTVTYYQGAVDVQPIYAFEFVDNPPCVKSIEFEGLRDPNNVPSPGWVAIDAIEVYGCKPGAGALSKCLYPGDHEQQPGGSPISVDLGLVPLPDRCLVLIPELPVISLVDLKNQFPSWLTLWKAVIPDQVGWDGFEVCLDLYTTPKLRLFEYEVPLGAVLGATAIGALIDYIFKTFL